jgi:lipopolysaccharide export system protein LptA
MTIPSQTPCIEPIMRRTSIAKRRFCEASKLALSNDFPLYETRSDVIAFTPFNRLAPNPMAASRRFHRLAVLIAAVIAAGAALSVPAVLAQAGQGPPDALQSLSTNREKLLRIEASTRELSDQDMASTFTGDVRVMLGETTIRCDSLAAYYARDDRAGGIKTDGPGPGGAQWIRKLVASGVVTVTDQNQTASGDFGVFELDAGLLTLTGAAAVTQGKVLLRGDRLTENLATGVIRMESEPALLLQ